MVSSRTFWNDLYRPTYGISRTLTKIKVRIEARTRDRPRTYIPILDPPVISVGVEVCS
jgi:hypothetical protein